LAFRDLGNAMEHRIANVPRVIGTRRSVRSNGECVDQCALQIIWNDATAFWSASTGDLDMVLLSQLFVGQPRHIGLPSRIKHQMSKLCWAVATAGRKTSSGVSKPLREFIFHSRD
jgi:hypothetical protein